MSHVPAMTRWRSLSYGAAIGDIGVKFLFACSLTWILVGCAFHSGFYRDLQQWRESREAAVAGPGGWMTLVGAHPLREGRWAVGRSRANDIRLPAGPMVFGVLAVEGGQVRFEPNADSLLSPDANPLSAVPLIVGRAGVDPTYVQVDSLALFVVGPEELELRITNQETDVLTSFNGLEHFPADPEWRIQAIFQPYNPPPMVTVPVFSGQLRAYPSPGRVSFHREGREHTLDALLVPGEDRLLLNFADKTNGRSTYGGGRSVYVEPQPDGTVIVDFNRAYNPACVFTPYVNCPLPPPGNRLRLQVTAGEKLFRPKSSGEP